MWSVTCQVAKAPATQQPKSPPLTTHPLPGKGTCILPWGYFIAFSPVGAQGMTFPRLVQEYDQISQIQDIICGANLKWKSCRPVWKMCKWCQEYNCPSDHGENQLLLFQRQIFPVLDQIGGYLDLELMKKRSKNTGKSIIHRRTTWIQISLFGHLYTATSCDDQKEMKDASPPENGACIIRFRFGQEIMKISRIYQEVSWPECLCVCTATKGNIKKCRMR
jgi:hypothetical protein